MVRWGEWNEWEPNIFIIACSKRKVNEWDEQIIEYKDRKCTFRCGWITHHYTYLEMLNLYLYYTRICQLVFIWENEKKFFSKRACLALGNRRINFLDENVFLTRWEWEKEEEKNELKIYIRFEFTRPVNELSVKELCTRTTTA